MFVKKCKLFIAVTFLTVFVSTAMQLPVLAVGQPTVLPASDFSIDVSNKITFAGVGSVPVVSRDFQFGLYDYSWNLIATTTVTMDEWGIEKTLPAFTMEDGQTLTNGNYFLRMIIPDNTGDWEYSKDTIILICSVLESGPFFTSWAPRKFDNTYNGATYTINAASGAGGSVLGSGTYCKDDTVKLTAVPDKGFEFVGWYENGVKIDGANAIYTFAATADRTLEAKFRLALCVTLDKKIVTKGEYFNVGVSFVIEVSSNTAILTYTYDASRFEYRGFTPAAGVRELNTSNEPGIVKITVMVDGYNTKDYGKALFSAKEDTELVIDRYCIDVEVTYVLKDGDNKTIQHATASRGVIIQKDDFSLIELSDVIDMFGFDKSTPGWKETYSYYDFNGNGKIDLQDVTYIAQKIK